ncbi:restriction endonuclease subunit S [Pasteurellaceae bacterium 20609_3]|uniref:restriction endonuclease subunit S n=1 Tax=Spirabiliibacterium mucosae TaxID=28156 RepID=UPI0031F3B948|nr:restriction endonuclease subunit S [Spirabiliibacterium mucosae]
MADQIPFDIPEGWHWCRLKEICIFISRGKSPKYSDIKKYPVFAQKCNLKEGGISLEQAKFLNPETLYKWPEEYKLKTNDVLINSTGTGTVGRVCLFDEKYLNHYPFTVPDSHVSVVRSSININSAYLFNLLNSLVYQKYIENNLAGSTNQKELYIGVVKEILVPLPPLSEQQRIVERIEQLMPLVEQYGMYEEKLTNLEKALPQRLRQAVLQHAITGKLVPQDPNDEPASELLKRIAKQREELIKQGKIKAPKKVKLQYKLPIPPLMGTCLVAGRFVG